MSLPHHSCTSDPVVGRPSTWFSWHRHLLQPGDRVLDLACGTGRHSLAAARGGALVTGVDRDPDRLTIARREASEQHLDITWLQHDLELPLPAMAPFQAVFLFNYLDRDRFAHFVDQLGPGGLLITETYLEAQRRLGWGPENDDHLLRPGELARLAAPLVVLFGREALEPLPGERWRAVASLVAQKPR